MLGRCPVCKVGVCCTGTWICFPRGSSSPSCSGTSQSSFWLQSSDLSPFCSLGPQTPWGEFGNQELLQGMDGCKPCDRINVPHCSVVIPVTLRTRREPGRITIASA